MKDSIKWFSSYLNNRNQVVSCNNTLSYKKSVNIGVPQGTILGPILYLLFVNDFADTLIGNIESIMYADDSSLYCCGDNINEMSLKLQNGLDVASKWFHDNRLLINSSKSNSILLGSRQRVMDINLDVSISNETLQQVAASKFLGLIVDSSIQWSEHVDYLIKKLSPKLGLLYHLSKFLPQDSLKTIYMTLIQADIDYLLHHLGQLPQHLYKQSSTTAE